MAVRETHAASTGQKESDQDQEAQQGNMPSGNPQQDESRRRDSQLARRDVFPFASPFALLQRFFSDDLMNLFDEFGSRRGTSAPATRARKTIAWTPNIDVVHRNNELVVRADLPGVDPDDVTVEIGDNAITISGERKQEHVEEKGSVYRFERTYGATTRVQKPHRFNVLTLARSLGICCRFMPEGHFPALELMGLPTTTWVRGSMGGAP